MNLRSYFGRSDEPALPETDNAVIHGALPTAADTKTALEDLLDRVWRCEREAAMLDRIDLAVSIGPHGMTPDEAADAA